MKKKLFVIIGVILILIIIGIGYFFWSIRQPLYKFGSVSAEKGLRAPLQPPAQTSESVWQVEPDIVLHFDAYGNGHPVIIVHGGPGIPYADSWKGFRPLEDNYRFYYYHQRGAGESTRPIDRLTESYPKNVAKLDLTLGLAAQIADIERVRRILGEEKLLLIGHSFGGFVASMYASEFPERVEKLVLVAPADVLTAPDKENNIFDLPKKIIADKELEEYNKLVSEYFNFRNIFSKSDSDLAELNQQVGKYLLRGFGYDPSILEKGPKPGGWSTFAAFFGIGTSPNFTKVVENITAPTLILHGVGDVASLRGSRIYEKFIPNTQFVLINCPDTSAVYSHFIFDDCPAEFADAVREFLID